MDELNNCDVCQGFVLFYTQPVKVKCNKESGLFKTKSVEKSFYVNVVNDLKCCP